MEAQSAASVADVSKELRVSHASNIPSQFSLFGPKAAIDTNVSLQCSPAEEATSACMHNDAAEKAEIMRVQRSVNLRTTSYCSSLRGNRAHGSSKGASHQTELSHLPTPKVNCHNQPPDSQMSKSKRSVNSVAGRNILPAVVGKPSGQIRPRTVEEALRLFSDVAEHSDGESWPEPCRASQTGVLDTLEPFVGVEEPDGFPRKQKAAGAARICDIQSQRVTFSCDSKPPSVTSACGQPCVTADLDTNSESEEKGPSERPLTVELISELTDDGSHADIQVLIARSRKLTTVDAERGACDWKNFTSLSVLSLSHNHLTNITPLSVLAPTLVDINLSFNSISDLSPLFNCKRLQHLSAAQNRIDSISGIGCCENIKTLILFHNRLHGELERFLEHISSLSKLKELDVDENPLLALGSPGAESAGSVTAPTLESCTGNRFRGRSFSSPLFTGFLQRLVAKCPSVKTFGGVDVKRLFWPHSRAGSAAGLGPRRSGFDETGTLDNTPTPQGPVNVSEEAGTTVPVTHRTWTHKQRHSSTSICTNPLSLHNISRAREEESASDEPLEEEEDSSEHESDSAGQDDTASPEKVKKHVRMLRQENRNMYALLEENRELRRHIQYNCNYSNAVSHSAFADRTQSARPLNTLHLRGLCSPSSRPRTALMPKDIQATPREPNRPPSGKESLESNSLTVDGSKDDIHPSDSSIPTLHEGFGIADTGAQLQSRDESDGVPLNQPQSAELDSTLRDGSEDQQPAALLRWENEFLKQRLERMVKYVQLLRNDLDEARSSCIQGEIGLQGSQRAGGFAFSETQCTQRRAPVNSCFARAEAQADCAGDRRNSNALEREMSSTKTPSKASKKRDALDTNQHILNKSLRSLSSTSAVLDDPLWLTTEYAVTNGDLGQCSSGATPSSACFSEENDASQQRGNRSHLARDVGASLPKGADTTPYVAPGSRLQLTLRSGDMDAADRLERNTGDLKAFRRELGDTDRSFSRSTSACSCTTQPTYRAAATLGALSTQGEKKSASGAVVPKRETQQISPHYTSQTRFPSSQRVCPGNNLPSPLTSKEHEKRNRAAQELRPNSKQAFLACRPHDNFQLQARKRTAGATTGAGQLQYNGRSFNALCQRPLEKSAGDEGTVRQRSKQAAGTSLRSAALTENSTLTVARSKCFMSGSPGVHASLSSRQALATSTLPPLPKKANQMKWSLG